jgi:TIR domain
LADRPEHQGVSGPSGTRAATGFRIFLNYRREDASGHAGRLYDFLRHGGGEVAGFGKEQIFMDIDTIAPGVDFRRVIEDAVGSCDVFIAVIGRRWLDATDASGRRRVDKGNDFVRLEIEAALAREIPVVPALVQGAEMPSAEELPETLDDFAHRNAVELSDARWAYDVSRLAAWLKTVEEEKAHREQAERERAEREAAEREAAEQAERDRLEEEAEERERAAAERAERERQEQEAAKRAEAEREAAARAETAERERLEREREEREAAERVAAERAAVAQRALRLAGQEAAGREERKRRRLEREGGEGAAVEQTETERLEKVASAQAERQRQEKEATEPPGRRIRLPQLRRRYWIAIAAFLVGVAALGVLAAGRLGGEAPKDAEEPEAPQASEPPFPNEAERELLSHIPAGVRNTCGRYPPDSYSPAKAQVLCDMPNIENTVDYRLVTDTEREADSLFGTYCLGEPRPWKHGEVCDDNDPTEGASLYWTDNRFRISGGTTYSGAAPSELRNEWRCCLQLEPGN